jgi:cholesterol transport system auxiliary component
MRTLALALSTLIVAAGCQSIDPQSVTVKTPDFIRYDFGRLSGPWEFAGFPLSGVDVKSVPWLDTPAMQYRLEFDDGWRRRFYSDSQWAASPGALLERFLTRRIIFRQVDPKGEGCHLHILLHELEQTYQKPDVSHVTLEVLAMLQPKQDGGILAKRAFYIQKTAPTQDARGSVAATREAVQSLSSNIDEWLTELARDSQAVANRCRGV